MTTPFTLPPGSYAVTAQSDSTALGVRLYSADALGGAAIVSPSTGYYCDEFIDTTIPPPRPRRRAYPGRSTPPGRILTAR